MFPVVLKTYWRRHKKCSQRKRLKWFLDYLVPFLRVSLSFPQDVTMGGPSQVACQELWIRSIGTITQQQEALVCYLVQKIARIFSQQTFPWEWTSQRFAASSREYSYKTNGESKYIQDKTAFLWKDSNRMALHELISSAKNTPFIECMTDSVIS